MKTALNIIGIFCAIIIMLGIWAFIEFGIFCLITVCMPAWVGIAGIIVTTAAVLWVIFCDGDDE